MVVVWAPIGRGELRQQRGEVLLEGAALRGGPNVEVLYNSEYVHTIIMYV